MPMSPPFGRPGSRGWEEQGDAPKSLMLGSGPPRVPHQHEVGTGCFKLDTKDAGFMGSGTREEGTQESLCRDP